MLFTAPGERVNRPSFGTGLQQLLFAPNSGELATATQFLVQGALQQWLGDLIQVEAVQVDSRDEVLTVTVQYVVRRNLQRQVAQFTQPGGQHVIYLCCDERRRNAVRGFAGLNGIDFLEVVDNDAPSPAGASAQLARAFPEVARAALASVPRTFRSPAASASANITVDAVSYDSDVLVVHVDRAGDFSTYRLRLVAVDAQGHALDQPFAGLDQMLAAVDFLIQGRVPDRFRL